MVPATPGLHHVTALSGDPERTVEFYAGILGLRLVKRTVNHDARYTYHLYFADYEGTPGSPITFFPQGAAGEPGRFGAGQVAATAYAIPGDAVEYWVDRLDEHGVAVERTRRRGETVLGFDDPDGIRIELVATDGETLDVAPWPDSPVPEDCQLRGFHSVTLAVRRLGATARVLTDVLEYRREDEAEAGGQTGTAAGAESRTAGQRGDDGSERTRFRAPSGGPGSVVDVVTTDATRGQMGVGTVHHVAFRVVNEAAQAEVRDALVEHGLRPTEPIDRVYFSSVYAREPGGVLLEIATEGPGFTEDESVDELGTGLALPPWLEDQRGDIEAHLPPFDPEPSLAQE